MEFTLLHLLTKTVAENMQKMEKRNNNNSFRLNIPGTNPSSVGRLL